MTPHSLFLLFFASTHGGSRIRTHEQRCGGPLTQTMHRRLLQRIPSEEASRLKHPEEAHSYQSAMHHTRQKRDEIRHGFLFVSFSFLTFPLCIYIPCTTTATFFFYGPSGFGNCGYMHVVDNDDGCVPRDQSMSNNGRTNQ